ncbi:Peroxiredoxin OsmC [Luteitalea pratensis]|uniref:Peroxiredoxin OsmC n=1 Tax=Luteitalea pratensis TaxID=1855912 RepID=A0A143PQQ4_LUTPR|nr:OsmC family protein [Luteitalea pratensis]AMY10761.1 Peroxiredoxin OsmC [Luteitalea pratensis]
MQALPHRYRVRGTGGITGDVALSAARLTVLQSASPAEFDGPGDRWSPETLLVGAVVDCFILTFRAISNASRVSWISLDCEATGTLDRVDRVTQFTRVDMSAHLVVPAGVDAAAARHALEKAESNCLISRSLNAQVTLETSVEIAEPAEMCVPG